MNKNNLINTLKEYRKILAQKEEKRENNDVRQFYEDSRAILSIAKRTSVEDGMAIIITEDNEIRKKSPYNITHEQVCQEILDNIDDIDHINLSQITGDFGHTIANKYNFIFIRMASVLNGVTIVYYPEICNEYQIRKLEEFNNDVKLFNSESKDKVVFEYNGQTGEAKNDLDELIEQLKNKHNKTR